MDNPYKYLEKWSILTPNAPALDNSSVFLTYRELYIRVNQLAVVLDRAGIEQNHVVVTALAPLRTVEVTLALMFLGATSGSISSQSSIANMEGIDWILVDKPDAMQNTEKTLVLDSVFLSSSTSVNEFLTFIGFKSKSSMFRLVFTSGTTGQPKAAAFTFENYEKRYAANDPLPINEVKLPSLSLMGIGSIGGFRHTIECLEHGKPILVRNLNDAQASLLKLARKYGISSVLASPVQFSNFMKLVGDDFEGLSNLRSIRLGGTSTSQKLVQLIQQKFSIDPALGYGSTEGGRVARRNGSDDLDSANVGKVRPEVDIEIVSEDNHALNGGECGIVRYKTPEMIEGYFSNPEQTALSFQDGWFYPGDLGILNPDGTLTIVGRANDQINLGGLKLDPNVVDEWASTQLGVQDCATFSIADRLGINCISIAVVKSNDFDEKRFLKNAQLALKNKAPVRVFYVPSIPRNDMGKTQRNLLVQKFSI